MLDEVDAVAGNVDISIDDMNVIFVDVSLLFEGANSFIEDGVGNYLLLLQDNQVCSQFDSDEIQVDNSPKESEDDDSDEESDDGSEGDAGRFSHQNKVVRVSLDNKKA